MASRDFIGILILRVEKYYVKEKKKKKEYETVE